MDNPVDAVGVRVLGALIEKQFTTPDNYPLTLNALTAACNQSSNREPVMSLDESMVLTSLDDLGRRALVRQVHKSDSRAKRYRHLLVETLNLHDAEIAALCVLMLRGPQTAGEIRTRTTRLFSCTDLAQVEITLQALMTLSTPLVAELPRRPGQKEARFAHLWSGEPQIEASVEPDTSEEGAPSRIESVEKTLASVQEELATLRAQFEEFRRQFQ